MAVRLRSDVWKISVGTEAEARTGRWDPVLEVYALGVAAMKALPDTDVSSWTWAANTHGDPSGGSAQPLWSQCEHGNPFFLPWHRAYLSWFERTIQSLTGQDEWALPYWDYDPARPESLGLPPEFLVETCVLGGEEVANPLHLLERDQTTVLAGNVEVGAALAEHRYVRPFPDAGFGGFAETRSWGLVESEPHNFVHTDIDGAMGHPVTAGRDPIFWLHHANVDRLWEVWRALPGSEELPQQADLPAALVRAWNAASFSFGGNGAVTTFTIDQLGDVQAPPLEYRYESTDPPTTLRDRLDEARSAIRGGPMGLDEDDSAIDWEPVATQPGVEVGSDGADLDMDLSRGRGLDDAGTPAGLVIELAGMQADTPHSAYVVEVRTAPDAPAHRAGRFSSFGVGSAPGGESTTFVVNASEIVPDLVEEGWTGGRLSVQVLPDPDRAGADREESRQGIAVEQVTVYVPRR